MESLTPSVAARVQGIQGSIASLGKLMKGRDVEDLCALGDVTSTEYYRIDLGYLWCMAETALDPLEQVLDAAVASSEGRKSVQ